MAFPATVLDLQADIQLAGTWTPVTSYVYQRDGTSPAVVITRGRPDETTTQASPCQAQFQMNNRDGRFTTRNPIGPYYPNLTRNTPIRFSVPASGTSLRIEDDKASYASCPDSAGVSITGDTEIQVEYRLSDWSGGFLAYKWNGGTSQSWLIQLNLDGTVTFFWSTTGTNALAAQSTMPLPLVHSALKVTIDVDNGASGRTITFWTATTIGGTWTQLGAAVVQAGTTSIFDSVAGVYVGGGCSGRFYGLRLLSGIGGTVKASPDFTTATPGASTLTDAQGNVWTVAGTAAFSNRSYRFHGELSSLPQSWDKSGRDIWVPVTAAGVLRRLTEGEQPPVDSALKRALESKTGNLALVAYWPCEDGDGATQLGSAIGGPPLTFNGTQRPQLASDSNFNCSQPIPVLNGSEWDGSVPAYTSHGSIVVRFLMDTPTGTSTPNAAVIARVLITGGTVNTLTLRYDTGGALDLTGWDGDGNNLFNTGTVAFGVNGKQLWVSMELQIIGGQLQYSTTILAPGASVGTTFPGTIAGTVGSVRAIRINPNNNITDIAIGHIGIQSQWQSLFDDFNPLFAWQGETAGNRFIRLCNENTVTGRIYGYPNATVAMGPQLPDTFADLIQQCEDADRGQIYEPRHVIGVAYRTLASMTNQAAAATLDYSLAHLGDDDLQPTDDDLYTENDVTVSNATGTSYRTVLATGPLSIQPPPAGVGEYANSHDLSVAADSQLPDEAGWILRTGTVNEERYPVIPLNLARPVLVANAALSAAIADADIGDFAQVLNPPAWLPPGPVKQLVWGTQEQLGGKWYKISWNCVPESPYEVGVVADAVLGRVDTAGSSLHSSATSGATSLSVDSTDTYLWTTTVADFPFDIIVSGEQMTVTAISGASSPQTFTVTRSVNGVVKAHSAGEAVSLFRPSIVALTG